MSNLPLQYDEVFPLTAYEDGHHFLCEVGQPSWHVVQDIWICEVECLRLVVT